VARPLGPGPLRDLRSAICDLRSAPARERCAQLTGALVPVFAAEGVATNEVDMATRLFYVVPHGRQDVARISHDVACR
jgi:hypothetical protein